jgi:hypothetical protein
VAQTQNKNRIRKNLKISKQTTQQTNHHKRKAIPIREQTINATNDSASFIILNQSINYSLSSSLLPFFCFVFQ